MFAGDINAFGGRSSDSRPPCKCASSGSRSYRDARNVHTALKCGFWRLHPPSSDHAHTRGNRRAYRNQQGSSPRSLFRALNCSIIGVLPVVSESRGSFGERSNAGNAGSPALQSWWGYRSGKAAGIGHNRFVGSPRNASRLWRYPRGTKGMLQLLSSPA